MNIIMREESFSFVIGRAAPWLNQDGNLADEELDMTYRMHAGNILARHSMGQVQDRFNLPVANSYEPDHLIQFLENIYQAQQFSFR